MVAHENGDLYVIGEEAVISSTTGSVITSRQWMWRCIPPSGVDRFQSYINCEEIRIRRSGEPVVPEREPAAEPGGMNESPPPDLELF